MPTTILMGPPGSGKTTMACLTAVKKPVHVLDLDRKIGAMGNLKKALAEGALTYWELEAPLIEEDLFQRAFALSKGQKPLSQPQGWMKFSEMVAKLTSDKASMAAGTWVIDSGSRAGDHLKRFIIYTNNATKSSAALEQWSAYLNMWEETVSRIIDGVRDHDKDLIITFHEKNDEIPAEGSKVQKTEKGRQYIGFMDSRISPSIEGQFGGRVASYFTEVYALRADVDDNDREKVSWVCRVKPDGVRPLRSSFMVEKAEYPPDFGLIWGAGK